MMSLVKIPKVIITTILLISIGGSDGCEHVHLIIQQEHTGSTATATCTFQVVDTKTLNTRVCWFIDDELLGCDIQHINPEMMNFQIADPQNYRFNQSIFTHTDGSHVYATFTSVMTKYSYRKLQDGYHKFSCSLFTLNKKNNTRSCRFADQREILPPPGVEGSTQGPPTSSSSPQSPPEIAEPPMTPAGNPPKNGSSTQGPPSSSSSPQSPPEIPTTPAGTPPKKCGAEIFWIILPTIVVTLMLEHLGIYIYKKRQEIRSWVCRTNPLPAIW